MSPKQLLNDYLTFTKKDRIGALIFIFVIGCCIILPRLLAHRPQPLLLHQDSALALAIDTLQQRLAQKTAYEREKYSGSVQFEPSSGTAFTAGELFEFDPNTISIEDWRRLGLSERTSKTIRNYVSKGGRFYKPEDLQKIWGLPKEFYNRVKDFIVITSIQRNGYPQQEEHQRKFAQNEKTLAAIDVNQADTSEFISLPGIGSKLSARIIAFREKLGGFYSVEQIGETYGLPDSTFQKIKGRLQVNGDDIRKMNVNTATKDELKSHPYIRWNLANAIVEYRNQHGLFKNLDELKNIALVDDAVFQKVSPYLNL